MSNATKLSTVLIAFVLTLGLIAPALAQEEAPQAPKENESPTPVVEQSSLQGTAGQAQASAEVVEAVNLDEDIKPADLGIEEPKTLPGNPFYFFKNIGRSLRTTFTFNPLKKVNLISRYTNEKLMEAKKLAEAQPENTKIIAKAFDNYQKETIKLKKAADRIKETVENPEVNTFMDKFVGDNLKQQKLLGKLEKDLPPEVYEKIELAKEEAMAKFADIGLKLASSEALGEKLTEIADKQAGSQFKHFKNLEVLQELEDRVPDRAKEAIQKAQENSLKRLNGDLENMAQTDREKFKDYIQNIGGNETRHLEIVDRFEREELPEIVREELEKAKEKVLERVGERLKKYEDSEFEPAREKFLDHLTELGRMEDLRVIKELENNLPPEMTNKILDVKRTATKKIIESIENAESPEQQKKFFEKIDDRLHDVQQMEVFHEIQELIPPEKQEFFEKLKEKAIVKMKDEIERARTMEQDKRGMVLDRLAGDSPEHVQIFKELYPDQALGQDLMRETTDRLMRRAELIEDPERLEVFKRKIEDEEGIRGVIEQNRPEMFQKLEQKSEVFMEALKPERAKERLEQARREVAIAEEKISFLAQDLQKEVLEKGAYSSLLEGAKTHLDKAELATGQEFYGEVFGQATAAMHNASNALRAIDKLQTRQSFDEDRKIKFEKVFESIKKEAPEAIKDSAREFIPELKKIRTCPLPQRPKCKGEITTEKTADGCPIFKCSGEITCAGEGEKVNRNPAMGMTNQQCCEGLEEIMLSKSYSICKKEMRREEGLNECKQDFDCPQPLCRGASSKCVDGRCIIPMCQQIKPLPAVKRLQAKEAKPMPEAAPSPETNTQEPVKEWIQSKMPLIKKAELIKRVKPEPTKPVEGIACIQVITPAIGPNGECKKFSTPCDVPTGWKQVSSCDTDAGGEAPSDSTSEFSLPKTESPTEEVPAEEEPIGEDTSAKPFTAETEEATAETTVTGEAWAESVSIEKEEVSGEVPTTGETYTKPSQSPTEEVSVEVALPAPTIAQPKEELAAEESSVVEIGTNVIESTTLEKD